ncbi:sulfurtransferase TusA family protein [Buchnera aphidicola]|uniref:Sulfurtransferase TusA n=1 Tax=Buchnera aphidicola (Sarucallis kahawaluokalani) TaxID=1241878 RepID=A0A4D6Y9K9_9GAMM|nr:sulfurtransferase TusA family protein [Buchnera aphidicola]QCI26079.1 sulfurtransferase TusA [Buchnera aphidicola (Sarucallis kahawaluokalani)]
MALTILNLTQFKCPDTIFMLKKNIRNLNNKNIILILTCDISTKWEIPLFCKFMKYQLITKEITYQPYKFLIKKNKK